MSEKKSEVVVDESLVFSPHEKFGFTYNRTSSTAVEMLEQEMKKLYNPDHCLRTFIVPSGMAAISTALHSILSLDDLDNNKWNLLYGNQLFSQTPKIFQLLSKIYDCTLHEVDVRDNKSFTELVETKCKGQLNILFVESCSNPDGYILDHEMVKLLRESSKRCVVVMDNTWLTAAVFNPLAPPFRADMVVNSLTKYYSCGTAIGGAVILGSVCSQSIVSSAERWIKMNGLHVSPHNAQIIVEQLKTLTSRVEQSSKNTMLLLDLLSREEKKEELGVVCHPSLPSHPSYELAKKYWRPGFLPAVFTWPIPLPVKKAKKIFDAQKFIDYKTSFGSSKSRIDPFHPEYKAKFPNKTGEHKPVKWTKCRWSIGSNNSVEITVKPVLELLKLLKL